MSKTLDCSCDSFSDYRADTLWSRGRHHRPSSLCGRQINVGEGAFVGGGCDNTISATLIHLQCSTVFINSRYWNSGGGNDSGGDSDSMFWPRIPHQSDTLGREVQE